MSDHQKQPPTPNPEEASAESAEALGNLDQKDLTANDAEAVKGGSIASAIAGKIVERYDQSAKNVIQSMRG